MAEEPEPSESRLYRLMEALIESQRRGINGLELVASKYDVLSSDMTKLLRSMNRMDERTSSLELQLEARFDALGQKFESMDQRFNAVVHRLDEIEQQIDQVNNDVKSLRIDGISQYNEILNAIQSGLANSIEIKELRERLDNVERRLAP